MDQIIKTNIEGLCLTPLKTFPDERGKVMHMMKSTSPFFKKFGEVYFSFTNHNVIKGWKLHLEMEQNFVVPVGEMKLVFYDGREDSITNGKIEEILLSPENYHLLTVPSGLWYSFQGKSAEPAMLVNCATLPHDPDESRTAPLDSSDIPYTWT